MSENKQNGFPKGNGPENEHGMRFTVEEHAELNNLKPAATLWEMPEAIPESIRQQLPGEDEVQAIFEGYYGDTPPEKWTIELARAMVNLGRKRIFRWWKQGKLKP